MTLIKVLHRPVFVLAAFVKNDGPSQKRCPRLLYACQTERHVPHKWMLLMRSLALLFLLIPSFLHANGWDALSEPGAIAIMRHAPVPGTGDPPNLTVGDCSTQRNLDARGRAQARAIGDALRDQWITFDVVLSGQWCRTSETAELLILGPVFEAPPLNSFFRDFSTRDQQTAETRELISGAESRLMLVTHQVNVTALTGQSARSGEILVIRMSEDDVEVLGSVLIQP